MFTKYSLSRYLSTRPFVSVLTSLAILLALLLVAITSLYSYVKTEVLDEVDQNLVISGRYVESLLQMDLQSHEVIERLSSLEGKVVIFDTPVTELVEDTQSTSTISGNGYFADYQSNDKNYRTYTYLSRLESDFEHPMPHTETISMGYPMDGIVSVMNTTYTITICFFVFGFFIGTGLLLYWTRVEFKQTDVIFNTIERFVLGDLTRRIPPFKVETELNKLGQRVNNILNRAEFFMSNNRQITNNIAHDLRKPLTRIRNRMELLLLETDDENQIQELEKSISDADNLLKTFHALLSISQAESGLHRDTFEKISLKNICEDMIDLYSAVAEENNTVIHYEFSDQLNISGSKQLITQLISNLIDNACKYVGENGKIVINGRRVEDNKVRICLSDNGPGIPDSLHAKVLERFVRLDQARTAEGNGLGLSLASAVMALHDGKMHLEATNPKSETNPGLKVVLIFNAAKNIEKRSKRNLDVEYY